ncbi:hypothetical protein [Allopontixanthobacter sediminis]|uniref:hypothetical protein n=1 Tax=Allopontixanthobacter sediminis TaxID=1689985 RepID=UPI00136E4727|nr:hypothetical protein [Allopontixanthobacter sediminis]
MLETFVSRNNRIDGYWALGSFQAVLIRSSVEAIQFDLVEPQDAASELRFRQTLSFYRSLLIRIATSKRVPIERITHGYIEVRSLSPTLIECIVRLTLDQEAVLASSKNVFVRVHDASTEHQSGTTRPTTNSFGA